jgi:soluble epoxide hydrolase/lipid-phosphate phosphatase
MMLVNILLPLALWLPLTPLTMAAPAPAAAVAAPSLPKKSYTIPGGPKYAYVYSPAKPTKPTFLLLHGFPSTSADWSNQIKDLTAAGYGVLAPDQLGYGETDKPVELDKYAHSKTSGHIAKILDHEGLKQVIGVGHDW